MHWPGFLGEKSSAIRQPEPPEDSGTALSGLSIPPSLGKGQGEGHMVWGTSGHHSSGGTACLFRLPPEAHRPGHQLIPVPGCFCQPLGWSQISGVGKAGCAPRWLVSEVTTILVTVTFGPELVFLFLHLSLA